MSKGEWKRSDFLEKREEIDKAYRRICPESFLGFLRGLTIPAASGARCFDLCIQPFQKEAFESIAPSIHDLRDGQKPERRRFWIERTKKSAKDSDLAIMVVWLVAFPRKPFKCQICAANHKQARIIEDRSVELLHYNPWLRDYVEIVRGVIRSRTNPREVWAHIESTDSSGAAHGQTPDLLILNELVHVARWRAMEDHMHNADGVPSGVVIVSTNAGIRGTKAWAWRERALVSKRWTALMWSKPAPWLDVEDIEDAKARDPIGSEFKRLWRGIWISGMGDAVGEDELERSFVLEGRMKKWKPGIRFLAGLDLGVSHDHAGIAVVGVDVKEQVVRTAFIKGWKPSLPNDRGDLEVDSSAVEHACRVLAKKFRIEWFGYDPAAGGSFMAQRLRADGIPMREVTFSSPKNLTAMATSFVQLMKDGKLLCYEDKEGRLRRDFGKFNIRHRPPSGYKLEAISDEYGHADVGVALVITLPRAVELLDRRLEALQRDDVIATPEEDDKPLTKKELNAMPPELRDIYDAEEEAAKEHRMRRTDLEEVW